ncbi:cation:proton antiporter family protein [Mycoplasmopsis columbinasalis]|uniref:Transmembrane protein n=1 Tax=Mycoplasmopsis columbinasalis TaxID=114880 RepID=A0A449BAX1_9BACT|nr:hypothetical protein [Mycoplasmopsis columbinasalis]VEU78321.1 Uncharacterised protein [Mycoplasmopsis columbinasalis]
MNAFFNFTSNVSFWWLPLVVFFLTLGVEFVWGFFLGGRTALTRSLKNIFIYVLALVFAILFTKYLAGLLITKLLNAFHITVDSMSLQFHSLTRKLIVFIAFTVAFGVFSFLGQIIFWIAFLIVRSSRNKKQKVSKFKQWKNEVKNSKKVVFNTNEEYVLHNAKIKKLKGKIFRSRLLGGGISLLAGFPVAVLATNASSFVNHTGSFVRINDQMLKVMSFGTMEGISKYSPAAQAIYNGATNVERLKSGFQAILERIQNKANYDLSNIQSLIDTKISNGQYEITFYPYLEDDAQNKTISPQEAQNIEFVQKTMSLLAQTPESTSLLETVLLVLKSQLQNIRQEFKKALDELADTIEKFTLDVTDIKFKLVDETNFNAEKPNISFTQFKGQSYASLRKTIYEVLRDPDAEVPKGNAGKLKGSPNRYNYFMYKIITQLIFGYELENEPTSANSNSSTSLNPTPTPTPSANADENLPDSIPDNALELLSGL